MLNDCRNRPDWQRFLRRSRIGHILLIADTELSLVCGDQCCTCGIIPWLDDIHIQTFLLEIPLSLAT